MGDVVPPHDILAFWREAGPGRWFTPDDDFDELCRLRFLPTYQQAAAGALDGWKDTAEGALALVILLDQMPRNMFRGEARTWAADPAAVRVAQGAIRRGFDAEADPALRRFFYIPFMHAEDPAMQEQSLRLHEALGDPEMLEWSRHHHGIVARFGRFPHRNAVLGRASTAEEHSFLEQDDAFQG